MFYSIKEYNLIGFVKSKTKCMTPFSNPKKVN